VRRPLHNDAGEAPGVPAGRRRLSHATALDAGLLLLPFKLRPPVHHTSRLHRGRPRSCQLVDWLRHHYVVLLPISIAARFNQEREAISALTGLHLQDEASIYGGRQRSNFTVKAQRCERAGEVLEERHLTAKMPVTTRRKTGPESR
jgi:hypothetical protein